MLSFLIFIAFIVTEVNKKLNTIEVKKRVVLSIHRTLVTVPVQRIGNKDNGIGLENDMTVLLVLE